ncbi:MAG: DUF2807 domain-containing protein [Anaerolineae bacterium]|nr:DUF2807 domain-containing protein [Anaerolineae bacterium]
MLKILRLLVAMCLVAVAACTTTVNNVIGGVVGSGNVQTETRDVSNFTAVELNTSGTLNIQQGETEGLTIEAEDNLLPLLTSEIVDGTLQLGTKPGSSFSSTRPIIYRLTVESLEAITLNASGDAYATDLTLDGDLALSINGSGNLQMATITANTAILNLSGSGDLDGTSLESDEATFTLAGSGKATIPSLTLTDLTVIMESSGDVTVGGTTEQLNVQISGSGSFDGSDLASQTAVVDTSSSGDARLQVSESLNATVSGSGSIFYSGEATVQQVDNASGNIVKQ